MGSAQAEPIAFGGEDRKEDRDTHYFRGEDRDTHFRRKLTHEEDRDIHYSLTVSLMLDARDCSR